VKRLVHVSSIAAFRQEPRELPLAEDRPLVEEDAPSDYARTKADADREVLRVCGQGLHASIVVPTAVIGPHDYKPSPTGRMICNVANGRLPAALHAGFNWVDARDVADVALACAERGVSGRHYIVAGHWATLRAMADIVGETVGRRVTWMDVPFWTAYAALPFATVAGRLRGRKPSLTRDALRVVRTQCRDVRSDRARQELGYVPRPFEQTIGDTTRWMIEAGRVRG